MNNERKKIIDYCMRVGLISDKYECPTCHKSMKLTLCKRKQDGYIWECRATKSNPHRNSKSLRNGTWFEDSKLSIVDILLLTQYFIEKAPNTLLKSQFKFSSSTVVDWRSYCREVCVLDCESESVMIGGENVIVEIDESKFGKRKNHRGRHVDGRWVFGGIERGTNKCFLKVVENRSKEVLLGVIRTYILPGTTIYSDCWKSYDCLQDEGFVHLSVNHRLHFRDPDTGVHTNSIEGTWAAVKRSMPRRHAADYFESYLQEYIWRRSHSNQGSLLPLFMEAIKRHYPPRVRDAVA